LEEAVPTYTYACTECDHRFDAVQSFSDDSLTVCPECAGRLRKVFNAVGVVFKGGGFYRTDSRNGSSASVPSGKGDSSSDSSGSSGGSSGSSSSDSSTDSKRSTSNGSAAKSSAGAAKVSDGSAA
jgi:putative FmdB family regulatory protein